MAEVRASVGVPIVADFGGLGAPTQCAPLVVDASTGIIYSLKTGDVVVSAGTGGTVTSVGLSAPTGILGVSGSPITTSGVMALAWSLTQGDVLYASASNTLASLSKSTTATRYLSNTGVSNNPAWAQVSVTTGITGVVPLANGGTAVANTTAATGTFPRGNGTGFATSTLTIPNTSTSKRVVYSTGTSAWGDSSAFTFDDASVNGLTITSGTVSDAVTNTFSRTTTDATSGTKTMMRFGTVQADPASNSSASYSGVWITNQSPATNSVNFTGSILGSFYEATHRGSGTLTTLSGMQANVVQSAGAGAITVLRTINANMSVSASSTLVTGFQPNIAVGAAGAITTYAGMDVPTTGTITAGGAITSAFGARVANLGKTGVTNAIGLALNNQSGAATSNTVLLLGTLTAPSGTYSIHNASTNQNVHAGSSFFGGTTTPTARGHFAAGTTAASTAPIKLTSGTSMTSAEAGAVEFTTDDLFFTITTGTARKRVLMADAVGGLTSGTIAKGTTNGRLANSLLTESGTTVTLGGTKYVVHSNGTAQLIDIGATGDTGSNSALRLFAASTKHNWEVGNETQVTDAMTITPSTATNGTTFTTPLLTLYTTSVVGVAGNIEPGTDDTYYLGKNDDDTPKAWKGLILKDQTTGTYYRLQIDSGAVHLVDLTD